MRRGSAGPYSKIFERGPLAPSVDGRSMEGRLIRKLERELITHIGGAPSITQRLLIERIIKTHLQLRALDEKLAGGTWTDHDRRTQAALANGLRLCLRDLGVKPVAAKPPSLAEYLSAKAGEAA
jgi:hypothetical protein